jgi:C4-dicarboxylate transporter DctM subunit
MALSIPIAVSLGFASMAAFAYDGSPVWVVAQRMFTGLDSTVLLAIPLFIFAGVIMSKGGISRRITDLSYELVGFIPGSLAIVTVISCMFFAAISGSAPATVAAIGGIMVPTMIDDGYPAGFAAALAAAGGTIGCIIPPSIPFVNYSMLSGTSVADMFTSGILPGILMGLALCILSFIFSYKNKWGRAPQKFSLTTFLPAFKNAILALLMPVIILGGIYGGIFTPTEAAGVACFYGIIVAVFIYRDFKLSRLPEVAFHSAVTSGMILFIIATANSFAWIITTEQLPAMLVKWATGFTDSPFVILLLINVLLLINGCFMEETATTFIFVPILLPLALAFGVDPVHFGCLMVINMTLGLLTPPLGINLFVANGLDKRIEFNQIVKWVMPLFGGLVVVLFLVTYIPSISLTLVRMMH